MTLFLLSLWTIFWVLCIFLTSPYTLLFWVFWVILGLILTIFLSPRQRVSIVIIMPLLLSVFFFRESLFLVGKGNTYTLTRDIQISVEWTPTYLSEHLSQEKVITVSSGSKLVIEKVFISQGTPHDTHRIRATVCSLWGKNSACFDVVPVDHFFATNAPFQPTSSAHNIGYQGAFRIIEDWVFRHQPW